jgi:hypothetical protein
MTSENRPAQRDTSVAAGLIRLIVGIVVLSVGATPHASARGGQDGEDERQTSRPRSPETLRRQRLSRLSKMFAPDWSGMNLNRTLGVVAVMAIPPIVSIATGPGKVLAQRLVRRFVRRAQRPGRRLRQPGPTHGSCGSDRRAADVAGIRHRNARLGTRRGCVLRGHARGGPSCEVRRASFRYRLSAQRLVPYLCRPARRLRPGAGQDPRGAPGPRLAGRVSPVDRGGRSSGWRGAKDHNPPRSRRSPPIPPPGN